MTDETIPASTGNCPSGHHRTIKSFLIIKIIKKSFKIASDSLRKTLRRP
jgi:hypothetical protein